MDQITKPGPELRARMEMHHPALTALVDDLYAGFGARLLSFRSKTAGIDVVAKRVADAMPRAGIRVWPETSAAEARELEEQRLSGAAG